MSINGTSERTWKGHGFGTAPVFLAGISTILGAVLFLRFGYTVGHVGLLGAVLVWAAIWGAVARPGAIVAGLAMLGLLLVGPAGTKKTDLTFGLLGARGVERIHALVAGETPPAGRDVERILRALRSIMPAQFAFAAPIFAFGLVAPAGAQDPHEGGPPLDSGRG